MCSSLFYNSDLFIFFFFVCVCFHCVTHNALGSHYASRTFNVRVFDSKIALIPGSLSYRQFLGAGSGVILILCGLKRLPL